MSEIATWVERGTVNRRVMSSNPDVSERIFSTLMLNSRAMLDLLDLYCIVSESRSTIDKFNSNGVIIFSYSSKYYLSGAPLSEEKSVFSFM